MTKTIKRIIAGISTLAILAGAAVGGWLLGKSLSGNDNSFSINQTDNTNSGAIIGEGSNNGIKLTSIVISKDEYALYGVSALAETAYSITPTVLPAEATNKNVILTVAFKNSSSSWAKGKNVTDYVTISKTTVASGDNFTVSCLKAFSEQIVITATAEEDDRIASTVTVDYLKKPLSVTPVIKQNGVSVTDIDIDRDSSSVEISPEIVWSDGTIEYDACYIDIAINYDSSFATAVREQASRPSYVMPTSNVSERLTSDSYTFDTDRFSLLHFYGINPAVYAVFDEVVASWEGSIFTVYFTVTATVSESVGDPSDILNHYYYDESLTQSEVTGSLSVGVGSVDLSVATTGIQFDNSALLY